MVERHTEGRHCCFRVCKSHPTRIMSSASIGVTSWYSARPRSRTGCPTAQRKTVVLDVEGPDDIDRALAQAKKEGAGGIIVPLDVVTRLSREHLARVAVQHHLPSIYWERDYVEAGGLVSYGFSLTDVGQRAAHFVNKILKGAKPADLPVEQPTKFDLVINLKTAKALGLTIPQSIMVRADELIQ